MELQRPGSSPTWHTCIELKGVNSCFTLEELLHGADTQLLVGGLPARDYNIPLTSSFHSERWPFGAAFAFADFVPLWVSLDSFLVRRGSASYRFRARLPAHPCSVTCAPLLLFEGCSRRCGDAFAPRIDCESGGCSGLCGCNSIGCHDPVNACPCTTASAAFPLCSNFGPCARRSLGVQVELCWNSRDLEPTLAQLHQAQRGKLLLHLFKGARRASSRGRYTAAGWGAARS